MVAPIRTIVPFSTWGRNASCWARLKRWISSTNRMVFCRRRVRSISASATTWRISFTPDSTAENATKRAPATWAISEASVVLPEPGGPHRIIECSSPLSIAARRTLAGPQQVVLAHDLVQRARPHAIGQRPGRRGARRAGRLLEQLHAER